MFGLLQHLHSLLVVQNVVRFVQHLENLLLYLLQLLLVFVVLNDDLNSLIFVVWVFLLNARLQELIFKSFLRDREVNQSELRGDLRCEVRVSQLGREEKLEVFRIIDDIIADFNAENTCIFEGLLREDGV